MSRRTVLSIALAVCFAWPISSALAAEADGGKNELHVMSFNIRYGTANDGPDHWKNRKEQVCELIGRSDCDLIGLQEALRFQIDEIRAAVPIYGEIGVGRDDGRTKGEYSGILYRTDRLIVAEAGTFWLSDTPEVPGSMTWGNRITRICTWARFIHKPSGKAFYLFNTHFDHQSQPSREKAAVLVARRIRDRQHPDPVIFTGDFNAGESNPAVRYLLGDLDLDGKTPVPFVDSFRLLHPDATEVGTFNAFKGTRTGDKIDYIFVLPDAKVREARILYDNENGRYPSDHFPITARLILPD
ncbi:endonuclease/exonuclease/phosphatase family protein [Anaerobaca lacustris]|uniref:Endonuclease/exonuclease/phosphatase family protein n=1 Tax=Anaerobaca lacustris TaxID=3044600 RepID=A0AAW6TZD0_9BACT|nr:endonuclease/exonuclease/phosphatase family protein [Sedimentisphaerales bacterium M17dextr]